MCECVERECVCILHQCILSLEWIDSLTAVYYCCVYYSNSNPGDHVVSLFLPPSLSPCLLPSRTLSVSPSISLSALTPTHPPTHSHSHSLTHSPTHPPPTNSVTHSLFSYSQVFGVVSGTSILFRISTASEPVDVDQSSTPKKLKVTYNKKTTGDVPRTTTATSSGLRRRNTAASRTRSGRESRDTQEGGRKPPVVTSEDTDAVTARHIQVGVSDYVTPTESSPGEDDTTRDDDKTPTRTDPGSGDSDPSGYGHREPPAQYNDTVPLLTADRDTAPSPDRDTGRKSPVQ